MLRETQRSFYENLNPKFISDNQTYWRQVKPFFSDKTPPNSKIILVDDNEIISDSVKCAVVMNNFFINAAINLDIDRKLHTENATDITDPAMQAIEKYKYHPSIIKIQEQGFIQATFNFSPISILDMQKEICNLDSSKAYKKENILPKVLQENADVVSIVLSSEINRCLYNENFPSNLKNADITPTFKKGNRLSKDNYRPISILPTLSKVYEKLLYHEISDYFNCIFSKYLCGLRKYHSTQHCLLFMVEMLKISLDNGLLGGIVLTDLSKAFDSIAHDLLIANLNAYGFSNQSLNIIVSYLSDGKQRTKINDEFSTWFLETHKVLCWDHFLLISILMICFYSPVHLTLQTMLMTVPHIRLAAL